MLLILLGYTGLTSWSTNQITSDYQEMMGDQELRFLVKNVQYRIAGISNDERGYFLHGDSEFVKETEAKADDVRKSLSDMKSYAADDKSEIEKVEKAFDSFYQASKEAREAYAAGHKEEAISIQTGTERDARKALEQELDALSNQIGQELLADLDYQKEQDSVRMTTRIGITMTAIIFGLIIGFFLYRSIAVPIRHINQQMKEIAEGEGDLTRRLSVTTKDELGELSHSFNAMLANLRELILQVRANADQVAASSEQLTASAEQTSKATENIAMTTHSVARGTEQQVESVRRGSQSIGQLSAAVQQISGNAESASAKALLTAELAQTGNQGMETAITQVGTARHTMNQLGEVVKGLGVRSQEIGQIVEVITGIAAQTNLLALNAAIEAARAGEHGRGFSVVADEVRKLAEQSSQSAQQIAQLITDIQAETSKAVDWMEAGKKDVTEGIGLVTAAGDIFAEIHQSVQVVAQQIQEVSGSSRHMMESTAQVVQAIEEIAGTADSAAAGTQEVSAATEEQLASMEEISASAAALSHMAEELQALISRFKV
ncbi:methyl-accepting chemotaxis protein [Brevibacillus migulae]|uniref:methyl-accepting chemotaxis protein n=1 Tax=Brevibacillus migulae TaxID=1644114 RepID=UPI00106E171F|nr:methyl-accepting chemotaxis protein [Brevibacillus migulae]